MSDMVKSKNRALENTIKLLTVTITKLDNDFSGRTKKLMRDALIYEVANLWKDQEIAHLVPIRQRIMSLASYSEYDTYFKFKLAECVNFIRCIMIDEPLPTLNLN